MKTAVHAALPRHDGEELCIDRGTRVGAALSHIGADVARKGWCYLRRWHTEDDGGNGLVELASRFGALISHGEVDGFAEVLTVTCCDEDAPAWQPFNRPEPIGWHNDYSTWADRPELSFAWIAGTPVKGQPCGDWGVASCDDVVAALRASAAGRRAIALLSSRDLPFCFADDEPIHSYRVLSENRGGARVRYYDRAIRLGLERSGIHDDDTAAALVTWSTAVDAVAVRCKAHRGALLVCDNWRTMHSRTAQAAGRRAMLCSVKTTNQRSPG